MAWDPDKIWDMVSGGNGAGSASMIPAMATAYKQWQDAGKYRDFAKETAAKYGDPFGAGNRSKAQEMFFSTYSDPEKWLNDPGHQAKLKTGLDTVSRQNAAQGYLGSGNMMADLAAYTANENNKWLDAERGRLSPLMGAQFNPQEAGKWEMEGNNQAIASENAAMGSMMYPFGAGQGPGSGGPGGGMKPPKTPQEVVDMFKGITPSGPAGKWIMDQIRAGGTVDPNDPHVAEAIREMTGGDTPWNNGGYNQDMDADGDGTVSYDEWANANNDNITSGFGGGDGGGSDYSDPSYYDNTGYDPYGDYGGSADNFFGFTP
jgi:hypothetical protein